MTPKGKKKAAAKSPVEKRPPFIMFDVKGELAVEDELITGIVEACGGLHQLTAIRVRINKEYGYQEPDSVDSINGKKGRIWFAFKRVQQAATEGDPARVMTTVKLAGRPGDWVIALLPLIGG